MKKILILLIIPYIISCVVATTDSELTKIKKDVRYKIASEIKQNELNILRNSRVRIKDIKKVSLPYSEQKFKATVDLVCFDNKTGRAEVLLDENIIGKYSKVQDRVVVVARYKSDNCL